MNRKYFFIIIFFAFSINVFSQTYSAYVNSGEKSFNEGDYYSATQYFQKAIEFENEDPALYFKMAEASRLFNDYYSGAYWYNQTVLKDKDTRFPLALFYLAEMNKMRGEYETAKNLFYRYHSQHAADSNFFSIRAREEIKACDEAWSMMKDTVPAEVRNIGTTINTVYSDFGAQNIKDSLLYFSSLRFENKDPKTGKTKNFVTKILSSKSSVLNSFRQPVPLDTAVFNPAEFHNANSAFSNDFKIMIFTRCIPVNHSEMKCELYASKNERGKWSPPIRLNDSINMKDYTATQPSVVNNGAAGYVLYFVSDRPGGVGKLDIWRSYISANGNYSTPENLKNNINSADDDITPFYHLSTQTLYFSSDRVNTLGGYDIFKSKQINDSFSSAENIGYPLNSSTNDLYFTLNDDSKNGLLSSNRIGSLYIKAKTCCYDIYAFKMIEIKPVVIDTAVVVIVPPKPIEVAKQLLPLQLYFHNDEPDPKTTKSFTLKNYQKLYSDYIAMKPEYEKEFSKGLNNDEKQKAIAEVNNFFDTIVTSNYRRLETFSGLLLEELKEGKKIQITVRGFTSPLAKSDYNVHLSKRRISAFLNYLQVYKDGAINDFVKNKKLTVIEDPAGESYVKQGVSDNLSDQRNSVYNPAAAVERRIEVIDVKME